MMFFAGRDESTPDNVVMCREVTTEEALRMGFRLWRVLSKMRVPVALP